jgi:hypothetical protein
MYEQIVGQCETTEDSGHKELCWNFSPTSGPVMESTEELQSRPITRQMESQPTLVVVLCLLVTLRGVGHLPLHDCPEAFACSTSFV